MIHNDYQRFVPGLQSPGEVDNDLWFVFRDNAIMVKTSGNGLEIPKLRDLAVLRNLIDNALYLGRLDDVGCYVAEWESSASLSSDTKFVDVRSLLSAFDEELFFACGRASQILRWRTNHAFCGRCGTPTREKSGERARECPVCSLTFFPRLSPAVIVAVVRDNTLLLARRKNGTLPFSSVLAGFVEPGESLEQCVRREILEEVNIRVKTIRYFGSQPWPFPDSLMLAFTADYDSGDLRVDDVELETARWYGAHEMPAIPLKGSVSRMLIDWFIETHG
jgi:NAD+ diphosphatase